MATSREAPATAAPELNAAAQETRHRVGSEQQGFLKMKIFYNVDESELTLEVVEGRDVVGKGRRACADAYVKAYLLPDKSKKSKRKTAVMKAAANPVWKETITWELTNFSDHMDRMLDIALWDNQKASKNAVAGHCAIKLSEVLPPNTGLEGWFEMFDQSSGKDKYRLVTVDESQPLHIALNDYSPRGDKELLLRVDDRVVVVQEDGDWSLVQNAVTSNQGYVPSSFVAPMLSLESEAWYFGKISRAKAEKLLNNPMRKHGCFLIRESESIPGSFSFSMRDGEDVRHFRITNLENGKMRLQGSPSPPFDTLRELVAFHKVNRAGLTTVLREACPKEQAARAGDLSYEVKDKWEVPREDIELTGVLGQGQYGEVFKGLWTGSIAVAVKTLKADTTSSEDFLQEAALMKELKHPNLIQLYAVCTIGEPIFIIIELMANGCLLDFLRSPDGEALRLPHFIDMATDIASGMSYLEANNYIHRDLAARNVLVGENNVCKVADFGFARLVKDSPVYKPETLEKFPVRWTAPEAMAHNKYSIKSDVWSFAILLTELISYGRKPYQGLSNREVVQKLEEGFRMPKLPGCPDGLYTIMLDCWKTSADDRPTFESLVFRLEDFFTGGEHNYTEANKVLD